MIVKAPDHCPGRVFDASGVELEYVVWADTQTGEAVHLVRDDTGFVRTIDDSGKMSVATEWRQHPPPLRYAPGGKPSVHIE